MWLTTCFGHCCARCCSRCRSRRRSPLSKWRRRGPLLLPSGSGTGFGAGTGSASGIPSGFASGGLRTCCVDRTCTVLRSAAMSFWILWRSRSLECSSCRVASSKFCFCCCCFCCIRIKPSCSYCRSRCLLLSEGRCGGSLGFIVCCWASLCNLSLRVLYLDPIVLCRLSSIVGYRKM